MTLVIVVQLSAAVDLHDLAHDVPGYLDPMKSGRTRPYYQLVRLQERATRSIAVC
jgi:hypothetical protein